MRIFVIFRKKRFTYKSYFDYKPQFYDDVIYREYSY